MFCCLHTNQLYESFELEMLSLNAETLLSSFPANPAHVNLGDEMQSAKLLRAV